MAAAGCGVVQCLPMASMEAITTESRNEPSLESEPKRSYEKDVIAPLEALKEHFEVRSFGEAIYGEKKYPLFVVATKEKNPALPNIFISAGVHGSEPAGVYAALKFLKERAPALESKANMYVIPCVNPAGFESGKRQNSDGTDINRDFVAGASQEVKIVKKVLSDIGADYSFSLDMHEDSMDDADPEDPADIRPRRDPWADRQPPGGGHRFPSRADGS